MKIGRKLIALILAAAMILAFGTAAIADESGDIVVLYTNDVHCAADDSIGYAGLAAYKADMLSAGSYVTMVDAGDAIQGGVLGTLSKGAYITDIMNAVGYDIAVPGNHEFDYGMEAFLDRANELRCGYISCNFMDLRTGEPVFDSYRIVTYGSTKVAYVGISTPESISKSTPVFFRDEEGKYIYGFCAGNGGRELYAAVQKAVDAARAEGAEYVVAVGHCGVAEQSAPWRSTDIIENVSGLTAFIDGHSHSVIPRRDVRDKDGKTVLLTSTGTKLAAIGKLVIRDDGAVDSELVSDYTKKDKTAADFIDGIMAANREMLDTVVAWSNVTLTTNNTDGTRAVRNKETNLGDLAADAYRLVGGADIGFVNGGGIRADIPAGAITYGDIIDVFPFNNSMCVIEATGREIIDALEMAARYCPEESGGFLHVSGLTYSIDTTVSSSVVTDENKAFVRVDGSRRVGDVLVLSASGVYEPIDLTKTYTLASHDFMLKSGGDGLSMFMDKKILKDSVMLDNQMLIDYITANLGGVVPSDYAAAQGRITIRYKVSDVFADIMPGSWYEEYVQSCYDRKIMTGVSASSFSPGGPMTRAMLVTMLYRMAGSPDAAGRVSDTFSDCPEDAWYAKAVLWASQNDIVEGRGPKTFAPAAVLTRQEMAVILYRYAVYSSAPEPAGQSLEYSDAEDIAGWALPGVTYCTEARLMTGVAEDTFDPLGPSSRAMGAAVVARLAA